MSSFICDPKHFNSVEQSLNKLFCYNDRFKYVYELKKDFPVLYQNPKQLIETIEGQIKAIIDELRYLNIVCVTLQYRSHFDNLDTEIARQKEIMSSSNDYQELDIMGIYKALNCISYQIETEHLNELGGLNDKQLKAYKFLLTMEDVLAHHLIRSSKTYDSYKWEIC